MNKHLLSLCVRTVFCEQNRRDLCSDGDHSLEVEKKIKQKENKDDVSCNKCNVRGVG